ncbi:hypothetical protein GCM10027429_31020 [Marivirga atlantica]|jgi:hypothetical protein|uniref:Uncharacterized protein n=1 Tax=Marivirga atlantica TaxID=1548457 RepID=A0A937AH67_9BACT|nr:hypothetical protein [Marivirga atlantica]MBL0766681.1 hypothetical protein [Marivirga atlantica]
MELEGLNRLLEKYWEGQLSDKEEDQFKADLLDNYDALSGELKELADWFNSTASFKESLQLDDDFDDNIMAKIQERKSESKDSWNWWKVAAAILVIITLSYTAIVIPQQKEKDKLALDNTQQTPEMAFEETKATLALMASMMNNGKAQLESLELFKVAQDKIKNKFEKENNKKENS